MFWLFALTVLSRKIHKRFSYELVPFWSYKDYFAGLDDTLLPQIIANIVLFIPIGFAFQLLLKRKPLKTTLLISGGFSLLIELVQLVTRKGLFEFDDVIHNVLGALIGYGLYRITVKMKHEH